MRLVRSLISRMFGYSIERLDRYDDAGMPISMRFEARCPHSGEVVTSSPSLMAARHCVIARELQATNDPGGSDAQAA